MKNKRLFVILVNIGSENAVTDYLRRSYVAEWWKMSAFDSFEKKHDYLICVDSDGCVMDTMNCKHFHCFGPRMVHEWALEKWQDDVLRRWYEINLFRMTRGINRFVALSIILSEISEKFTPIIGVSGLQKWVSTAPALSNDCLAAAIAECEDDDARLCLRKALEWSILVNEDIARLPVELRLPFSGSRECLALAHQIADIAIVSGANRDATEEEWESYGLKEHTDIILTQDVGSTAFCISKMLEFGYDPRKVLMVGDAPGDYHAARETGVWYFPILVNWEEESWDELRENVLDLFAAGDYGMIQADKIEVFVENLGG